MSSNVRRLQPEIRLSDRVLRPVERLARVAGVSASEIIEFFLVELLEGDVTPAASPGKAARRPPAAVIPITRARGYRGLLLGEPRPRRAGRLSRPRRAFSV